MGLTAARPKVSHSLARLSPFASASEREVSTPPGKVHHDRYSSRQAALPVISSAGHRCHNLSQLRDRAAVPDYDATKYFHVFGVRNCTRGKHGETPRSSPW